MLDRQRVHQLLTTLDWSRGFNREGLLRAVLDRNLALPNEFLSAIQLAENFDSPDQLLQSVPEVVWTIHEERERRARGQVQVRGAAERTRRTQAA